MKKVVLKVDLCDDRSKCKAMKITAARVHGVNSITMDMKLKKMTVVGDDHELDPVFLTRVLRKRWGATELVSVGPVREQKDDNYDREEDGGGAGSSGGRGGSGRGDGRDSDGGDNDDDHQDPCNQSGGQKGSLFFNLTDYNNWRRNARRVQILMCFFFFEVQRFVLLLRGSTRVFTV